MTRTTHPTIAVVLAGGVGSRMGLGLPKQLLKIAGKPVIEHTVDVLQKSEDIDEIIVLMSPGYLEKVKDTLPAAKYPKVTAFLEGGETRNETTQIALSHIGYDECNVLFHDAVRPLLTREIIHRCVRALEEYDAVDVAIPSADTIIEVEDDIIQHIPDRSRLRRGQTPQAFRKTTIQKAYEIAKDDPGFQATDDCSVVLKYLPDVPIKVVDGEEQNMKVTYPIDAFIMDKLFQLASTSVQTLLAEDRARLLAGKTLVVFGGSYGIGGDIVEIARVCGAEVFSYSRSATGTHVERREDVAKALKDAQEKAGKIDYVVNTAGLLHIQPLSEMEESAVQELIDVNYKAPVMIAKESLSYLAETKGQLLLFTSSSYTRGRADYSLYSSSKAATVNLTQALADEWGELGVRVNCINPERTATPMRLRAFGQEDPDTLLSSQAVAQTSIDTLLTDITGQVVDVRRKK
jgi:2-C-methyl-D-erythritol 4-phosphate cytidylyltransferase